MTQVRNESLESPMQDLSFSFENNAMCSLGTPETPLFAALDIFGALDHTDPRKTLKEHDDTEDLVKAEIETKDGKQLVNCVNESAPYALIFGSKPESARRFKKRDTSEILLTVRRTGRYECLLTPEDITSEQDYLIQAGVQCRIQHDGANFQTLHQALETRFKVPSSKRRMLTRQSASSELANCAFRLNVHSANLE